MNLSNLPPESNATGQLMVIQRLAHHEDRLLNSKPAIDNKLRDFSHLFNPSIPSKKKYLNKKRTKEIYDGNISLLSRIYSITFEKNAEGSKYTAGPKRFQEGANIISHPFSADHRSRSMNTQTRKKELDKINKDNSQLLEKLRTMKSTIPSIQEIKKRDKSLNYFKNMLTKKHETQNVRVVQAYVNQKSNGESVLYKYMKRHDLLSSKPFNTHNDSSLFLKDNSHDYEYGRRLNMRPTHEKENEPEDYKTSALNSSDIVSRSHGGDFYGKGRKGVTLRPLGSSKNLKKKSNKNLEAEYKYFKQVVQKELDGMEKVDENRPERRNETSPEKSFNNEIQKVEKNYINHSDTKTQ